MADWRGGELRQMRIEIWQSKQILILESGGKKRKCRKKTKQKKIHEKEMLQ